MSIGTDRDRGWQSFLERLARTPGEAGAYVARNLPTRSNRHPLLPPTVLDGRHSPAFFPAPRGSLTGHAVDLAAETSTLLREVVHPTIAFRAKHLWRLGTIRRGVRWSNLAWARGRHLLRVRKASGRADYAVETDLDLLAS